MKEREIESAQEATYRNERFNRSMRSLDWSLSKGDSSKFAWLSDGGASAERMYAELDKDATDNNGWDIVRELKRTCAINRAMKALKSQGKHSLAETLQLIYKYGNDRNRSIRALALAEKASKMTMKNETKLKYFISKSEWNSAKARYFRNRKELLELFV